MKRVLSILISAMLVLSLCTVSICMIVSAANEPASNNIYAEDFESYEVGSNKNEEIFHSKKFMWFESAHHDTNIVERNGSKAIEYSVIGDDGYGYTRFGGFGTGDSNNLANLIDGVVYTLSMDIEILTANPASELYIEYQTHTWTGIKFIGGQNPVSLNGGSIVDLKYENGKLEMSFVAGKKSSGENGHITITGAHMEVEDKIYIDNIEIKPYEYNFDYEGYAAGTNATSSGSNIGNVWNGGDSSVSIVEVEGNKCLEIAHASVGADAWQVVYLNNLWNLKPGWTYRLSMDVLCNEYIELYLCYPHNTSPNATYSQSGYVGKSDDSHIVGGSFDGSRLTFDFKPDTSVDAGFWAQICIVIKHNGDMKLQLDNITIAHLHTPGEVTKENEVAPSCSAEGSYDNVAHCTECGVEIRETVVLDKVAHTEVVDEAVDATCSATGKTEGKHCSVCGEVTLAQEDTEKLPHTEVVDPAVDATCSSTGKTEGKHCSVCNEILVAQEDTEMLSHTYDDDTDKDCNVCGAEREVPEPVVVPWYMRILEAIIAFFKKLFAFL